MKNKTIGEYVSPKPQAWVAVSSNRQKIYGKNNDLVYLDNGQEFQIELYNPTSIAYLVKIYLNDLLISSSGLVLKPGQRYFLDRYIDEKKKFLFSTYEVEDSEEVKEAIKNNGRVKVEFYPEQTNWLSNGTTTGNWTYYPSNYYPSSPTVWGGSSVTLAGTTVNNLVYTSNAGGSITSSYGNTSFSNCSIAGSLETGRVEKGNKSDQNFGKDFGSYSWFCTYKSEYQILPRSVKPTEVSEIRSYCTECGSRVKKKSWKFCPNCGESLD